MTTVPDVCNGFQFAQDFKALPRAKSDLSCAPRNVIWEYFQNYKEGPGIFKWEHYFDIYQRHLAKFVGRKVDVLEIGIYSGGSLKMWRSYFGEKCHVYGVDIQEACKAYEDEHVTVFIGDQADRNFWRTFKSNVQGIDVVVDDGGHRPEQQQITLEELLGHIRPGGVYVCEDVHGVFNNFAGFVMGFVHALNSCDWVGGPILRSRVTQFQSAIHSIHFYPYVIVIEKHFESPSMFTAPKHGTEWQPF